MVMACLALSITGICATTISTAVLGVGVCLVSWQQAAAVTAIADGKDGGYQISGKVDENILLGTYTYITPLGVDSEITGNVDGNHRILTVWNSQKHPDEGPYTLTLSGQVTNLNNFCIGGRNRLVIKNGLSMDTMQMDKTLRLYANASAGSLGELVLEGTVSGFQGIYVDKKNDGSGSVTVNGDFVGTGAFAKTGTGNLTMNGTVSNVSSINLSSGAMYMGGTFTNVSNIYVANGLSLYLTDGCTLNQSGTVAVNFSGVNASANVEAGEVSVNNLNLQLYQGYFNVKDQGQLNAKGQITVNLNGGSFDLREGGKVSGRMVATLSSGYFTVDGELELLDGSSITMASSSTSFSGRGSITGSGSLTKKGEHDFVLKNSIKHKGTLIIEEGAVQWVEDATSTDKLTFSGVEVKEGTSFRVLPSKADASDTKVTLSGGDLVVGAASKEAETRAVGQPVSVSFGELEVKKESRIQYDVAADSSLELAFAKLSGSANVSVAPTGGAGSADRILRVNSIQNYNGTLDASNGLSHIEVGAVSQDKDYTGVLNIGSVSRISAQDFSKTGAGSFSILSDGAYAFDIRTSAGSEFRMGYDGLLDLGAGALSLHLGEGTTLRYVGESLYSFAQDKISLDGTVYVKASDFSSEQLSKGVSLGLSADALANVKLVGTKEYEFYAEDGVLCFRATLEEDNQGGSGDVGGDGGGDLEPDDEADYEVIKADAANLNRYDGKYYHGVGLADDVEPTGSRKAILTEDSFDEDYVKAGKNTVVGGSAVNYTPRTYNSRHDDMVEYWRTIRYENGVWIWAQGGTYSALAGGNYADTYAGFHSREDIYMTSDDGCYATSFEGDTHIILGEKDNPDIQPVVGSIVGGNYGNSVWQAYDSATLSAADMGEPRVSSFTGNSYITIYGGRVDWVVGGSYQSVYDFVRSAVNMADVQDVTANPELYSQGVFKGDSHVYVYNLLQGDGRNDPDTDFVAGGNLIDMKNSLDYLGMSYNEALEKYGVASVAGTDWTRKNMGTDKANSIPFYFIGDSLVVVDLGRTGAEVEQPKEEFGKMLVGGDYIRHDRGWAEHWGDTTLRITRASGVKFTERVVGGNYDDGNSYTHMTGNAYVSIDSGTFFNMVVAGSNQGKITDMHAETPITSLRKALFSTIDGGTYLTITGGRFTGYASSLEESIPSYTLSTTDQLDAVMHHSVGRVAIVGGNYLSQAANATKNLMTINQIANGTHVDISNAVISGHVVGATVMEGDSHHDDVDNNGATNGGGESNQWAPGFRGDLYVDSVTMEIANTQIISTEREEEDSGYAAEGWKPRVVGGYLLHVADDSLNDQIVTAQWDEAGQGFYYPGIKVGRIDLTVSDSTVYDVVGGSWVACLDVYAEEVHDFLEYYCEPRADGSTYSLAGVEQGQIHVTLDNVVVKGDVIAGGIQGGITKIVSESTTVNISNGVTFETPENHYRKENIVSGAYFSSRHKNYMASKYKNTWDNEVDPYYSFYANMFYPGAADEPQAASADAIAARHNVSYVEGMRTLNFTDNADSYGKNIHDTILLNFDHVDVKPKKDATVSGVNAAGLLITDTGNDGTRDTIYLHGGGEMQLVPDFMLIPVWEENDPNGTLSVPSVATSYKWLHNNSYIVVQGQGTMLTLLTSETRDGWIAMDKVYDDLLNVQKLRVEEGSILHIDQRLAEGSPMGMNAQPVAVRDDIYMCQGSAMMLDTNISLNEMRTREDAAIREAEIITDLRTDAEGKVTNGKKPTENISDYTVSFEKAGNGDKPTFRLHIDRVEEAFYKQDKFRRYLIDYVNPEAFNSAWANELGVESSVTEGSIAYDAYTQHTLEKWFDKGGDINGYDKYRIRVKDNDDGTYSLVIEGMRIKQTEDPTPEPGTDPEPGPGTEPDPGPGTEPDPGPGGEPDPGPTPPSGGYHVRHAHTPNGKAGAKLLDEYYPNPSENSEDRDKVLDRVFELNVAGREAESDRLEAAVAGSSISALGMAAADDVERQMRLIRNRATKSLRKDAVRMRQRQVDGGKAGIRIHEYPEVLPPNRYSMWVNAEGDYRLTAGESTDPGYRMNAWGGTVGGSYAITNDVEAGLAITAMYGDFRSKGPDALNGDMDTSYLSTFVRVDSGRWSHLFIATLGLVDIDATRTVNIGGDYGSYSTHFDTQGYALGLMYELGYTFMLNREKTAMIQPVANIAWRRVVVDGFTESGSDAALRADRQAPESFILGAGVRSQMLLGGETLNRNLLLELRALAKGYLGSLRNTTEVGFADRSRRAVVRSRRQGPLGLEIGAGLTIPITVDTDWEHAIFIDFNLELRNALDNANFTVGYKLGF